MRSAFTVLQLPLILVALAVLSSGASATAGGPITTVDECPSCSITPLGPFGSHNRAVTLAHGDSELPAQPTATPSPPPPGDITLTGRVYEPSGALQLPIIDATVAVTVCQPRTFQAQTDENGEYALLLPAMYISQCAEVTLAVRAAGYETREEVVRMADLRSDPNRNFALMPVRYLVYLPRLSNRE